MHPPSKFLVNESQMPDLWQIYNSRNYRLNPRTQTGCD